ncbi:MAG: glycosyltransferase [Gaiellaceae bacterium]|jgi:glycosyltransferase involved in cell wall biosynthesis
MNPRVSIVMPAFQAERTIAGAISSVLRQTYRELELVVVDDGSSDATAEVVRAHRGPIRLVHQENRGVAAARNRGISEATGELIAFCDADDFLFDKHIAALVATYERHDGRLATANSYWLLPGGIDASKKRYKGRFPAPARQRMSILEQNFVSTMSIFPRGLVDEIGPFNEQKSRAEDWDFWLRAIFAGYRVALQSVPLALYRWGDTGLSADRDAMDAEVETILDGVEERYELTDEERSYLSRRRAGLGPRKAGRTADDALRAGRYREAARYYNEAASLCPSERRLVWKARTIRLAPRLTGPLVRARQLRIERALGLGPDHVR